MILYKERCVLKRPIIIEGDITKIQVDAAVNAANNSLLGGGGVDGAIHRAAGAELLEECRTLNGCKTGEAKITRGYKLPAMYVIHTVGPVWQGGGKGEDALLASCYMNSLELAVKNGIKTMAFPSISTGAYGFPVSRAARIAVNEISNFMDVKNKLDKVFIVCFDSNTYSSYVSAVEDICGI